jgi:putative nucleotidyltransferase with HDIG domain
MRNVQEGDVIAKHIFSSNGQPLVTKGVRLSKNIIRRLKSLGIYFVYIEDERFDDVIIGDVISEKTRLITLQTIRDVFERVAKGEDFDGFSVRKCADDIYDEIKYDNDCMINLLNSYSHEDHIYFHSMNTAILSAVTGKNLGMNAYELEELIVGALLHDIGKVFLPGRLLYKKEDSLKGKDRELFEKHTKDGFDVLRKKRELSLKSSAVAHQHHENVDGSGYPRGLKGDSITLYSRIVRAADIYDTLLYVDKILPHEAVEVLMGLANTHLDAEVVKAFVRNVAIYPNGVTVKLNNGKYGVVIRQNRNFPQRPVIRLIQEEDNSYYDFDLLTNTTTFIEEVIV